MWNVEQTDATLEQRARAYLDANCAHCHNPAGAADTSALHLNIDAPLGRSVVHAEGVELVSDWIATLNGDC